jgi:hypothetical protein
VEVVVLLVLQAVAHLQEVVVLVEEALLILDNRQV